MGQEGSEGVGEESVEESVEVAEVEETTFGLDDLLNAPLEGDIWAADANHKGIDFTEVVGGLSPEAQKLVANLKNDYQRKTGEVAQLRKDLERKLGDFQSRESALTNIDLSAVAEEDLPENLDLYNPDHLEMYIAAKSKKQAADMLTQMLAPAKEEIAIARRRSVVEGYVEANPELKDEKVKHEVGRILASNPNMKVERAHEIWRGRTMPTRLQALEEENRKLLELAEAVRADRRAMGSGIAGGGGGGASGGRKPKTAIEAYRMRKAAGTLPGQS
jgi:hypothetical protein